MQLFVYHYSYILIPPTGYDLFLNYLIFVHIYKKTCNFISFLFASGRISDSRGRANIQRKRDTQLFFMIGTDVFYFSNKKNDSIVECPTDRCVDEPHPLFYFCFQLLSFLTLHSNATLQATCNTPLHDSSDSNLQILTQRGFRTRHF